MTDGHENSSRTWTWPGLKALITHQREVYKWDFIFLGADIDAVEIGERMGVEAKYAMTYDKRSRAGTGAAYALASEVISAKRMRAANADDGFSDDDRRRAMGQ